MPGPGSKRVKPYGLVEAASITSQMSMSIRSARIASSLTSAMLTERKMFSSSLESSATSGVETRANSSQIGAARVHALGGERQREVLAGAQAGLLEQRDHVVARRAGERRRLEDDELVLAHDAGEHLGGRLQRAEVGLAVAGERRRDADEDRLRLAQLAR